MTGDLGRLGDVQRVVSEQEGGSAKNEGLSLGGGVRVLGLVC